MLGKIFQQRLLLFFFYKWRLGILLNVNILNAILSVVYLNAKHKYTNIHINNTCYVYYQ